jgi:endonuclease/exonuclease/phosphatase family metal-dependent hydrolase
VKLRIVSYNIHKGFDPLNQNYILSEIRELIRSVDADLVCLQEVVGENQKLAEQGEVDNQFEFLADSVWNHYSYAKNAIYDHGHHGNLILSKYPIDEFENIDLSTNDYEKRGLLVCKLKLPNLDKKITVMTTHLNLMGAGRKKQYQKILAEVSHHIEEPIILAGDFNDWSKKASAIFEGRLGFEEVYKKLNGVYPKTFPAFYPFMQLDRIYAKNMKALDAKVMEVPHKIKLSDHLPLFAEVEVI